MIYIISGRVIRGNGYGKKIGYPTINLDRRQFSRMKKKPAFGVYAGTVALGEKKYRAGIIIGPLDKKGLPKVEAHLLEFSDNAYGMKVEIEIKKFLRKFRKFMNEKKLMTQIGKDMKKC